MRYIIAILTLLIACSLTAQNVKYLEGNIEYEDENLQTIEVKLTPSVSTIKDKFSDWMNDNYDVNLDGKKLLFFNKKFMTAEGIIIPQISPRKIDLRVRVDESNKGMTTLDVFASYGYNNWITPETHPYAYDALRGIVYDFVSDYLPKYYYEKVEESEKRIDKIQDDGKDLKNDLEDNKNEIDDLLKKNDELRRELEENKTKLKKANENLDKRENEYRKIKKKVAKE